MMTAEEWADYRSEACDAGIIICQRTDMGDTQLAWEITYPNGTIGWSCMSMGVVASLFFDAPGYAIMRYWPREVWWYRGTVIS